MRKDDDGQRNYLSLPACIAPLKASVLPLSNNEEFAPIVKIISKSLTEAEISHKIDETSGSIGKRYARTGTYQFKKLNFTRLNMSDMRKCKDCSRCILGLIQNRDCQAHRPSESYQINTNSLQYRRN